MFGMSTADRREYMRQWVAENQEHVRAYRSATRERRNARRRELYAQDEGRRLAARAAAKSWQEANPGKRKGQRLKLYGMTLAEFEAMLEDQGGACAICGYRDQTVPNFFPLVDHCHASETVRGLLCMNCNQGLGKFGDDPERLAAAIRYLSRGSSGAG